MTKRLIDSHSQYHARRNYTFVPLGHKCYFVLDVIHSKGWWRWIFVFSFLKGFLDSHSPLLSEKATRTVVLPSFRFKLSYTKSPPVFSINILAYMFRMSAIFWDLYATAILFEATSYLNICTLSNSSKACFSSALCSRSSSSFLVILQSAKKWGEKTVFVGDFSHVFIILLFISGPAVAVQIYVTLYRGNWGDIPKSRHQCREHAATLLKN